MTPESTFHALAIASIAIGLPVGLYFRIRSHATKEWLDRRQEGILVLVGLRMCGVLAWGLLAACLINPAWVSWCSLALPAWLRWLGAALALLVVPPLLAWTFQSLGKNLTDTVVTRRQHTLVTHGPYRWVRHPFYGVVFLWGLSLCLLTANWLLAVVGVLAVSLLVIRTRIEEAKLAERFGDAYSDYARSTGRFFPSIGGRR
jgi:protein-S-isoprenylcysteine O-methyltransferase Ste14